MDQEPAVERGPRILAHAISRYRLDTDQLDALESVAQPDLQAVGPELADEARRDASAHRLDLLGKEAGDLLQREPDDPAEALKPDLAGLDPEPFHLNHGPVREVQEVRPIG